MPIRLSATRQRAAIETGRAVRHTKDIEGRSSPPQVTNGGMTMYVIRYQWVWTIYGYQLLPVRVFVPVYYYTPVVYYYW
jgi:hypothetical protein